MISTNDPRLSSFGAAHDLAAMRMPLVVAQTHTAYHARNCMPDAELAWHLKQARANALTVIAAIDTALHGLGVQATPSAGEIASAEPKIAEVA